MPWLWGAVVSDLGRLRPLHDALQDLLARGGFGDLSLEDGAAVMFAAVTALPFCATTDPDTRKHLLAELTTLWLQFAARAMDDVDSDPPATRFAS